MATTTSKINATAMAIKTLTHRGIPVAATFF
jgi:hypothetical protein